MLKVLVLEDEKHNREFFTKILSEIAEVSQVFHTGSGKEAIELARTTNPNLIFLDIELRHEDLDGLEVAKRIYDFNQEAYFVFVTAYSEYAVNSFAVHPYSYIIKPIVVDEMVQLVKEIADKVNKKEKPLRNSITIKSNKEIIYLPEDYIVFIEIQNKQAIFYTTKGIFETNNSLEQISKNLGNQFIRVHRSYIVNVNKIKKIRKVSDRSYEIDFWDLSHTARMSRYQYNQHKKYFKL